MTFLGSESLMTALGFSPETGRLYERILLHSGEPLATVAEGLGVSAGELVRQLVPLVDQQVVRLDGDAGDVTVCVLSPADMVAQMITQTAAGAAQAHTRLQEIAAAMPFLAGRAAAPAARAFDQRQPLDGEVVTGSAEPGTITAVLEQTVGDVMWLRPDQFVIEFEDEMAAWIHNAVAAGRRVRGIYALRAMQEAPTVLAHRVRVGEEVRVLPELPTRLLVVGTSLAAMPEPLGLASTPSTVVRQRGVVEALGLWFEEMWARAAPVGDVTLAADDGRRFLLEQLAAGAQDEQMARRLGVSLRTVRRRVAELMQELGAGSRFQAGVEATRRGWI